LSRLKYINEFKIFEGSIQGRVETKKEEYDRLTGELLHLYGSIPLPKEKSSIVLKKIVQNSKGGFFTLGETVDVEKSFKYQHDRVRFKDYFESLLKDKDSRGHNFEGTLAGLFNGKLSTRGEKWDIVINGLTWSVKFIENGSKAPELGRYKSVITALDLEDDVEAEGGLTRLFQFGSDKIKNNVWENIISKGITGGWIIAFPDDSNNPSEILINIINVDTMKRMLMNGMTASPKGGLKEIFNLALSARFKNFSQRSTIIIPTISITDLREIARTSDEYLWATNVFGKIGTKIRPDVLRYIRSNSEEISDKLFKFKDFKTN
jgi:hypothetical protein